MNKKMNLGGKKPVVAGASATLTPTPAVDRGTSQPVDALKSGPDAAQELPEGAGSQGEVLWSSHPIQNYRIGRFRFEKGLIRLSDDDAAEFEALRETLPVSERNRTKKLDVAAAERLVRQQLAAGPKVTSNTDSSSGERADHSKAVGVGDLGHSALSQTDKNVVVDVTDGTPQEAADAPGQKPAHEA